MKTRILDCTLRDGGYYTNWDFKDSTVDVYINSMNNLPIEYIEVGYRSIEMPGYLGEYFYCPEYLLKYLHSRTNKKLVIILNEKDVRIDHIDFLLDPIRDCVEMIRLAIDPLNFERALTLAEAIRLKGFEVGFNVMYMSKWKESVNFLKLLSHTDGLVDYFYMVDSFGGVYPDDVKSTIELVRKRTNSKLGFHGHNNLELALINTLTAIGEGVDLVDVTVTGMGRGAGNCKTELLLTSLSGKGQLDLSFDDLTLVTDEFTSLQENYGWGTSLPYMVSGAGSLPQKDVMDWVSKGLFSNNTIVRALNNQVSKLEDNMVLSTFKPERSFDEILIVGGGPSIQYNLEGLYQFIKTRDDLLVIHASSRNVIYFQDIKALQIHCLSGNEGNRLEHLYQEITGERRIAVLPPYPRSMGTYVPDALKEVAFELESISVGQMYNESITAVVLELVSLHKPDSVYLAGYDGYKENVTSKEMELSRENDYLFQEYKSLTGKVLISLFPTTYSNLEQSSLYSRL